jgi:ankyrin repeat protein
VQPDWERALLAGDIAALERGLETGLDVDARDRYGQTGLMLAAMHGEHEAVAWLLERGASLDQTAKYRLSALMLAVLNGHREIVLMLVTAGADLTLRGSGAPGFADKTAYDLALQRGDEAMVRLLRGRERG